MQCAICLTRFATVLTTSCGHMFCHNCFVACVDNTSYPVECFSCSKRMDENEYVHILTATVLEKLRQNKENYNQCVDKSQYKCLNSRCSGTFKSADNTKLVSFICNQCQLVSCMSCDNTHLQGQTCADWKGKNEAVVQANSRQKELLRKKIESKTAMYCVVCGLYIERTQGCYGIKCTRCKTELCLITQKTRWGPKGNGDYSGGCGCQPSKKCHPSCGSCTVDRV